MTAVGAGVTGGAVGSPGGTRTSGAAGGVLSGGSPRGTDVMAMGAGAKAGAKAACMGAVVTGIYTGTGTYTKSFLVLQNQSCRL